MICFCLCTYSFVPGIGAYGYMWIQIHIMGGFGGYKAWARCFFYVQCSADVIWRLDLERQPKHTHWCHDGSHWDSGTPDSLLAVVIQALCQVTVNGGTSRARGALNFLLGLPSQCPQTGTWGCIEAQSGRYPETCNDIMGKLKVNDWMTPQMYCWVVKSLDLNTLKARGSYWRHFLSSDCTAKIHCTKSHLSYSSTRSLPHSTFGGDWCC